MKHLLAILFMVSVASWAAEEDDIYATGFVGTRLDNAAVLTSGVFAGYCPVADFGVGIFASQMIELKESGREFAGFLGAAELRYFAEPFEVAGALGLYTTDKLRAAIVVTGGYLYALTPSLAVRADLISAFPFGAKTLVTGNLGFRLIF